MTGEPAATPDGLNLRDLGFATMRSIMRGGSLESHLEDGAYVADMRDGKFGEELVEMGLANVFGTLWARDGLGRRERSLVTLGVLIALGIDDEMGVHVKMALNNGLTREEIAEAIYHAGGYAGFPRAMTAREAARAALGDH